MKRVLINVEDRELRVAILEDDQLVEFYSESLDERSILNNIYRGRIEGILPGLNAAFVNIGLERNAFLHFEDVRPDVIAAKAGIARTPNRLAQEESSTVVESTVLDPADMEARAADLTYAASEEELEAAREIAAEIQSEDRDDYDHPPAIVPTGIAPAESLSDRDGDDEEQGEADGEETEAHAEDRPVAGEYDVREGRRRRRRRRGRRGGRRRELEGDDQRLASGAMDGEADRDDEVASDEFDSGEDFGEEGLANPTRQIDEAEGGFEGGEFEDSRYDRRRGRRERGRGQEAGPQEPELRLFYDPRLAKRMDRRGGRPEDWANLRGFEPPPGYAIDLVIPDDDADAGTRAAINPFDGVFTPGASMSKRWKILALKRTRSGSDGQEVFFGPVRKDVDEAALEAKDSQEAIFGPVRVRYDENGEPIPVQEPPVIGGVKYAGHRNVGGNKANKFKKKRKRKGRHMKRNDRAYFAVRRKKSDEVEPVESVEAPPTKPSRTKKAKAVEEPVVEAPKSKRASRSKAVPVEEAVMEVETPAAKTTRASKAKAAELEMELVIEEAPKPRRASRSKAASAGDTVVEVETLSAPKNRSSKAKAAKPEVEQVVEEAPKPKRSSRAKAAPAEETVAPLPASVEAEETTVAPDASAQVELEETSAKKRRSARGRKSTASEPVAEAVQETGPAVVAESAEASAERVAGDRAESEDSPAPVVSQDDFLAETAPTDTLPATEAGEQGGDDESVDEARRGRRRRGRRGGRRHRDGATAEELAVGGEKSAESADGEADGAVEDQGPSDAAADTRTGRLSRWERRERKRELRWNRPDRPASDLQADGSDLEEPRDERQDRPERTERRDDRRDRQGRDRQGRDREWDRDAQQRAPRQKLPSFIETFKKGDEIMVQVIKEEIGTKGARITTYVTLPGRYLVLLPYPNEEGGVSRKVEDISERRRLKKLLRDISGDDYGFIIRTAGIEKDEEEIKKDAEFLVEEWRAIQESYEKVRATELVASDQDILYKLCRDVFDNSISEIIIDDAEQAEHLRNILGRMIPGLVDRVKVHQEPENLFVKYGVDKQLAKAARRKVWLKSGGYIIIDEAEALTAIDVNTGKFVGKDDQEKMILKTNLEAARTIARELKLRDIGGLIVVDFIDMKDQRNRDQLQQEFRACLKKDRSKTQVGNISEFGLIEMTRKRVRRSLRKTLFMDCPYCQGAGVILSERQIWLHIKHELVRVLEASQGQTDTLTVTCNPRIKQHIESNYRESVQKLEQRYGCKVAFSPTDLMHMENFRFDRTIKPAGAVRPDDN